MKTSPDSLPLSITRRLAWLAAVLLGLTGSPLPAQLCTPIPAGLVSWWQAESNALDAAGSNHGSVTGGVTYAAGQVGKAFNLDGTGEIVVNDHASLNVSTNLTFETWLFPNALSGSLNMICAKETDNGSAAQFELSLRSYTQGNCPDTGVPAGNLMVALFGINGMPNNFCGWTDGGAAIPTNQWTHLAVTFDGNTVTTYTNGVAARIITGLSGLLNVSSGPFRIGARGPNQLGGSADNQRFNGLIDEFSFYNRALSSNEVKTLYTASSAGKCLPPPAITTQPLSQTVYVGDTAVFSVTANGGQPLIYQWSLNGTNLPGATGASLTLTNVQPAQAGNYAVTVSNSVNAIASSNAVLTVNPLPVCSALSSNLVAWWRAEGNAWDHVSGNQGTLAGNTSYGNGMVGQAFVLDGFGDGVSLGNPTGLQLQDFTIEAWIKRASTNQATLDPAYTHGSFICYGNGGYHLSVLQDGSFGTGKVGVGGPYTTVLKIADTNYHHIVATKSGSNIVYYLDGIAEAASYDFGGGLTFTTPVAIGARGSDLAHSFYGAIDELAVYRQALSSNEVRAIYDSAVSGKCPVPFAAAISAQPQDQTVYVGETAALSVAATGTRPLTYQWSSNGTNLVGATNALLTLPNVQLSQAGNYSVTISNSAGFLASSNAVLSVLPPPPCASAVSNLVSWWRAEGNAADHLGGNQGTLVGNTTFGSGRVGQGFIFDGQGDAVALGSPVNLQLQNFTIEAWIKRSDTNNATVNLAFQNGCLLQYGNGGYGLILFHNGQVGLTKVGSSSVSTTSLRVADLAWHHVAVTKSGSNVIFYVDGTGETVAAYDPGFTFTTPVAIGARGGDYAASFNGLIDELAVYSRALSSNEVSSIYGTAVSGKCATPFPVSLNSQPQSQTVLQTGTATFSVGVAGTPPFTYQWLFNGTNLAGATNAFLTLTNLQPAQAGSYSLLVSNSLGSTNSAAAALTVQPVVVAFFDDFDPDIDTPQWATLGATRITNSAVVNTVATNFGGFVSAPNSLWFGGTGSRLVTTRPLNTVGGGLVRFYLRLSNGSTPNQWEYVDVPAEGVVLEYSVNAGTNWTEFGRYATTNYMVWTNISASIPVGAQSGQTQFRWRQLSNSGSSSDHWALDDTTILTLPVAPSITAQPTNQTLTLGGNASFAITATGTQPLSYQWQFNGTNLNGMTNASLTLTNVTFGQAGNYSVTVSNLAGSVTSSNALLSVNPPPCYTVAGGLAGWWPAEGNANDAVGINNGSVTGNVVSVAGVAGQAFAFDGTNSYVRVADTPALRLTNALTIEFWFRKHDLTGRPYGETIINKGGDWVGGQLNYGVGTAVPPFGNGIAFLFAGGNRHTGNITDTNWHHYAFVVTNGAPNPVFYIDGAPSPLNRSEGAASINLYPSTQPLYIGAQIDPLYATYYAKASIDELSIYNRGLSAAEIQAIYNANLSGKCLTSLAPIITAQPTNRTVIAGQSASFAVTATGAVPLRYQWRLNGTNLVGATNATLSLASVQFNQAGNYSVQVSNQYGAALSSNAVLTVNPLPTCASVSSGLVSWWKADGNASDVMGVTNGVLLGNATIGPGLVGQAFVFDGSSDGVELGNPPALQLQNFTIEGWVKRSSTAFIGQWQEILVYGNGGYGFGMNANGTLFLTKVGVDNVTTAVGITDTNSWHHVAVTKNGTIVIIYLDGTGYVMPAYAAVFEFTNTVAIGAQGTTLLSSFLGSIDELAVFNRALSSTEIQSIYSASSLGKCALPVCTPAPANLVSWWRAEGDFKDTASVNNSGVTAGAVTFTNGMVGQAFSFDGGANRLLVSNSPSLNFGSNQDFSIEAWVRPETASTTFGVQSIVDKRQELSLGSDSRGYEMSLGDGRLECRFLQTTFGPAGPDLRDGNYHHVVVSVVRNSATGGRLIADGQVVLTFNPTALTGDLSNNEPLRIGNHANLSLNCFFKGGIDEVSLYNRALTTNEVLAIYNAGALGKCLSSLAPVITAQPAGQTLYVGQSANFGVTATGAAPLSYQWRLNGTNLVGATNAALPIAGVQPNQAGSYSVIVSNNVGAVTSSNALLTVLPLPPCATAPANLVGWWPAEGNAGDAAGGNNGAISNVVYVAGKVGQAFSFNGSNANIRVPASSNLNVGIGDGFTLEAWINPTDLSQYHPVIEWNSGLYGVHLWINVGADGNPLPGCLFANVMDIGHNSHEFRSAGGIITTGIFQHVALTFNRTNGSGTLYVNGANVAQANLGSFIPQTSTDLYFGLRPFDAGAGYRFIGQIDEIAIYNRALSSNEIQAIYTANLSGKCPLPPPQPHAAVATAVTNSGFVVGVNFSDRGYGYTNLPSVRFIGGGGNGAGGYAVLSNGIVTSIVITNAGFGYTNPPLVVIAPPFIPNPGLGIAPMTLLTFSNLNVGSSYQLQRQVAGVWVNEQAAFTATQTTYSRFVPGAAGSQAFRLALTPVPVQAQATAQVINGFVVGALITSGGSGYTNPPAVVFTDGSGSNATAVAVLSGGSVTNIFITGAGAGYSGGTLVQIDAPPATALDSTPANALRVSFGNLSPYENYQLEFTPLVNGGWQNTGGLLTPTSTATTADVATTNTAGFYRLRHVP